MEGLNGHFCHGFYPQVRPKSHKNVIIETQDGKTYRGLVTLTWDKDEDADGAGIGLSPSGILFYDSEIDSIKEIA
jgi:hypothetical protein